MKMREKKYYAIINDFYRKYSDAEKDTDTMKAVAEEYRETVCPALCKYNFGLNRKQALWLCDTLGQGNWKKMWLTDEDNDDLSVVGNSYIEDISDEKDIKDTVFKLKLMNSEYRKMAMKTIDLLLELQEKTCVQ